MSLCCLFNKIIANRKLPIYLSSDHNALFTFHRCQANLRVLNIEEIKTIPGVPMSLHLSAINWDNKKRIPVSA